jgi:hypothetical protein
MEEKHIRKALKSVKKISDEFGGDILHGKFQTGHFIVRKAFCLL